MSPLISYRLLLEINPSKKLIAAIEQQQHKFLNNIKMIDVPKSLKATIEQQQHKFLNEIKMIDPSRSFKTALSQQSTLLQSIAKMDASRRLLSKLPLISNDYLRVAKPYVPILDANKSVTLPIRNKLKKTVSFYPENELEPLNTPAELPRKASESKLVSKLEQCEPGRKDWDKYQDVCKEILTYCLVPPLFEPIEQSKTKDGLHIRDIIFNIPYELSGFWNVYLIKYGYALVVECKNYKEPLKENQLRISSKYVGVSKLSTLGLILSRKGLQKSGVTAQENVWKEDKKMILCMNDEQLQKMLELKHEGDEPWKVIDRLIRDFLLSIS